MADEVLKPCPDFDGVWGQVGNCKNVRIYDREYPDIPHNQVCDTVCQAHFLRLAKPLSEAGIAEGLILQTQGNVPVNGFMQRVINESLCPHVTGNYLRNREIETA